MSTDRPANHGQSTHGLRGDYSSMRADYTVDQDHSAYTDLQHDRWRRLYRSGLCDVHKFREHPANHN